MVSLLADMCVSQSVKPLPASEGAGAQPVPRLATRGHLIPK